MGRLYKKSNWMFLIATCSKSCRVSSDLNDELLHGLLKRPEAEQKDRADAKLFYYTMLWLLSSPPTNDIIKVQEFSFQSMKGCVLCLMWWMKHSN